MKKFAFIVLFCMFVSPAFADVSQITVGSATVNIPIPAGFVDVTHTAPELTSNFRSLIAQSGNRLEALILTNEDAQLQHPELQRYFLIQVMPGMENRLTVRDFAEGRRQMRDMIGAEMLDEIGGDINQLLSQHNVRLGEMRFVPFESESENHIAFSMIMNMSAVVDGQAVERIMLGSYAMVLANERLFNVYVYSAYNDAGDLPWTQSTLNNWVNAIISAN